METDQKKTNNNSSNTRHGRYDIMTMLLGHMTSN